MSPIRLPSRSLPCFIVLRKAVLFSSVTAARETPKAQPQSEPKESKPRIEDVAPEDVKRSLDPTIRILALTYSFTSNYLGQDRKLYTQIGLNFVWGDPKAKEGASGASK